MFNAPTARDGFFQADIPRPSPQTKDETRKQYIERRRDHTRSYEAKLKEVGLRLTNHHFTKNDEISKADAKTKATADAERISKAIGMQLVVVEGLSL